MRAFFVAALAFACMNALAQLEPCPVNGKWSLCSSEGKPAPPALYDTLIGFYGGQSERFCGFIGVNGAGIVQQQFSRQSYFDEFAMKFHVDTFILPYFRGGKFDLLDVKGKVIVKEASEVKLLVYGGYDGYERFYRSLSDSVQGWLIEYMTLDVTDTAFPLLVKTAAGWGAVSFEGKQVLPAKYDDIRLRYFDTLRLEVRSGKKIGIYSLTGEKIIGEKYEFIGDPNIVYENEGDESLIVSAVPRYTAFVKLNGKTGMIDQAGREIIAPKYDALTRHEQYYIYNIGGKFVLREVTDSILVETEYEPIMQAVHMTDSLIIGGKFGLLDGNTGREIIPAKYDYLSFDDGGELIRYVVGGRERTSLDINSYSYRREMSYGAMHGEYGYGQYQMNEMVEGGRSGYLTKDGTDLVPGYDNVEIISETLYLDLSADNYISYTFYRVGKNGKKGILSEKKVPVLPLVYDSVAVTGAAGDIAFVLVKNGKFGIADKNGKVIIAPIYDDLQAGYYNGIYIYNKGGKRVMKTINERDDYMGYYPVTRKVMEGGRFGFVTVQGKETPGTYDTIYPVMSNSYDLPQHFIVGDKEKVGLAGLGGSLVIPVKYDEIAPFDHYNMCFVRIGNKWAMAGSDGKERSPFCDFKPWRSSDSYKPWYILSRDGKNGMIDTSGRELIPLIYDRLETGDPYGTKTGVYVVELDKKLGVYDVNKGKQLIPPSFDRVFPLSPGDTLLSVSIGGTEDTTILFNDSRKYKGAKWGIISHSGEMIVPCRYDFISPLNAEAMLFRANTGGKADEHGMVAGGQWDYYNLKGEKVSDGAARWEGTWIGKKALTEKPFNLNPAWKATNGPEGCDATAFYIDKKGNYWLGTGSSGGVYVSSNKGKTWKENNEGIGPMHIQLMGNINDTIFIKAEPTGVEEPDEAYYGIRDNSLYGSNDVYYFDKKSKKWKPVHAERMPDITDTLKHYAQLNKYIMSEKHPFALPESVTDPYFLGFEFNKSEYLWNLAGFSKRVGDSTIVLRKGFPKDVFPVWAGNLFAAGKNNILIGKSGVFSYDNGSITRLPEKGLIASDVTQVMPLTGGSYYARTGTSDIWYYDGKWTKLFDAYKEQVDGPASEAGYATGRVNLEPDGKILFASSGNIYEMDNTGSKRVLMKPGTWEDQRYTPLNAVRDSKNKDVLYGVAYVDDQPRQGYRIEGETYRFILYAFDVARKSFRVIDSAFYSTEYYKMMPVVFKDKKDNIWACSKDSIRRIEAGTGTVSSTGLGELKYLRTGSIGLGNNGEVAIADGADAICFWYPSQNRWMRVHTPHRGEIDMLGFDSEGNLYAGCNHEFEYYCGGKGKLDDPGLFRLAYTSTGAVWKKFAKGPNARILSIAPHPNGIAVGTSGSGMYIIELGKDVAGK